MPIFGENSYKREIALKYVKEFKNNTNSSIARLLVKEHPLDFKSIEGARSMVRSIRGGHKDKRQKRHRCEMPLTEKERKQRIARRLDLPDSDYKELETVKIAKTSNKILFLSDIHFPYQDNKSLEIALEYGKKNGINCIYLNGDTLDFYQASRFIKDRRLRSLSGELEIGREFLSMIKKEFDVPIYYKIGNHEQRLQNYLFVNAPELLGIPDVEIDSLLRFGELGIIPVKSTQFALAGGLYLLHGHEFGHSVFSPVNPARGLYMRAKHNSIIGHHHQTSEHSENGLDGRVVTTWSVGCLCGLRPEYFPVNKWNHGFAVIKTDGNEFEVDNLRIIDGKVR